MSRTIYITNQNFGDYIDNYIEITHSELLLLKNNNNLVPNQKYRVTDFKTIYVIDNGVEYILSNSNEGITYGIDSPYEPLIIRAATSSSFYKSAHSEDNPTDLIEYEFEYELTLPSSGYGIPPTTLPTVGKIISRTDTVNNITCDFDFRNVYVSLHKIDNSLIELTGTSSNNNQIYKNVNTTDGIGVNVDYLYLSTYNYEAQVQDTMLTVINSEMGYTTYANQMLGGILPIDYRMSVAKFVKTFTSSNDYINFHDLDLAKYKNINIKGVGNVISSLTPIDPINGYYHDININTSYNLLTGEVYGVNIERVNLSSSVSLTEAEVYFGGNYLSGITYSTIRSTKTILNGVNSSDLNLYSSSLHGMNNSKINEGLMVLTPIYTYTINTNINVISSTIFMSLNRVNIENISNSKIQNCSASDFNNIISSTISGVNYSTMWYTNVRYVYFSHIKVQLSYCILTAPIMGVNLGVQYSSIGNAEISSFYFVNMNNPIQFPSGTKYWYSTYNDSGVETKVLIPTTAIA